MNAADVLAGRLTIPVWSSSEPHLGSVLGVGRDAAYEAVNTGAVPVIRAGRRLVVPVPALLALLGVSAT